MHIYTVLLLMQIMAQSASRKVDNGPSKETSHPEMRETARFKSIRAGCIGTSIPDIRAHIYTHCATRRPLTARHKNNFKTASADIRASEKARKKNKRKERPADTLVKFSACGSRGSYNRERTTQRGTPALFIHTLNLANVLSG